MLFRSFWRIRCSTRRVLPRVCLVVAEQHIEVNRTGLWVAVITILGGVPRIIGLGTTPLWLDESYTGLCSRMMAADGWAAATACDHISPGYYVLAVISATLFGNFSETTMRLAAALAGLATIPAMAASWPYREGRCLPWSSPRERAP